MIISRRVVAVANFDKRSTFLIHSCFKEFKEFIKIRLAKGITITSKVRLYIKKALN